MTVILRKDLQFFHKNIFRTIICISCTRNGSNGSLVLIAIKLVIFGYILCAQNIFGADVLHYHPLQHQNSKLSKNVFCPNSVAKK
jgi:hypothetical protein